MRAAGCGETIHYSLQVSIIWGGNAIYVMVTTAANMKDCL